MLEFPAKIAIDVCRSMQPKPRLKWQRALTLQRLEFIRRNLDKTDAEIARMLGVGRTAVHFQRKRYKITKVHGTIQRVQRRLEQMRGLKPGLSAKAAALQLGLTVGMAKKYGKMTGYAVHQRARRETFLLAAADKKFAAAAHRHRRGAGTGSDLWSCRAVVSPAQIQSDDSQWFDAGASAHPALAVPPAP